MKKIPLKKMNSLVAPHKKRESFLTYNCDKETVNVYKYTRAAIKG